MGATESSVDSINAVKVFPRPSFSTFHFDVFLFFAMSFSSLFLPVLRME